jgi:hypothetical protein
MATQNNNMNLYQWNLATDSFDYNQLSTNFKTIADHTHENGKGVQIPTGGIVDYAITSDKLGPGAVINGKLGTSAVLTGNLGVGIQPTGNMITSSTLSSLTGLYNGYTIDFTDSTTSPSYVWRLRYDGSSKWYYVGGTPYTNFQSPASTVIRSTSPTSYGNINTSGAVTASVVAPVAGKYIVDFWGVIGRQAVSGDAAGAVYMSVKNDTTAATDSDSFSQYIGTTGSGASYTGMRSTVMTVVAGGTLLCQFRADSTGTANNVCVNRHGISIRPIYFG